MKTAETILYIRIEELKNESRFSKELTFTSLLDIASAKDDEHRHDLEDVDFFCLGKPFHVL